MTSLISRTPFADRLPLDIGTVSVREIDPGPVTSVAAIRGAQGAVSAALERSLGVPLPETGALVERDGVTCCWAGLDRWFVMGAAVPEIEGAMLTDQSDAWAIAEMTGRDVRDVLARLVPIDVSDRAFTRGRVARTGFGHMACLLLRTGEDVFRVMVYRSMAGSAVHDMERAMRMVAARHGPPKAGTAG